MSLDRPRARMARRGWRARRPWPLVEVRVVLPEPAGHGVLARGPALQEGQLGHGGGGQGPTQHREVLLLPVGLGGLGEEGGALLQAPPQEHLGDG